MCPGGTLSVTLPLPHVPPPQAWIPDSAEGIPNTMISLSGLLDKLTNDNTQIRMMHLELQGQKDELEGLLSAGNDRLPVESHENLKLLTQHLSEHLSHEESTLAALQGELRDLRQKIGAVEREGLGEADPRRGGRATGALVEERHVNRFLAQKENLVAEALMLRRELDKQRGIIASMREALEILIQRVSTLGGGLEAPTILEGLEEMEHKLAFELERSEIWETVYGTPKGEREKAKETRQASEQPELVGPTGGLGAPLPNVEAPRGAGETPARIPEAPPSNATPEAEFEALRTLSSPPSSGWARRPRASGGRAGKSPRRPRARPPGTKTRGCPATKPGGGRRNGGRADEEVTGNAERGRTVPTGRGGGRHPGGRKHFEKDGAAREGKRPKEAGKRWKRAGEKGQENGGKRQHHGHSKFWRKERALRAPKRRYRTPAGCTDVGSCAHKEGMDLFKVALEPVGADRFAALLEEYLRTSELGAAWADDLRGLAAPFFRDGVFIHDQVKFSDFVDDLEDYIEEIAEKVFGDDDAVEDFEDYIFRGLLGEAARKHKSLRKAGRKNADTWRRSGDGSGAPQSGTQDHRKDWDVSQTVGSSEGNLDKRKTEP
ncbi:LOW QUALITY PROTEIN: pre-B-cell leukemia transcription factor-interacting protein 1-like [Scyliorhinus torazame]|uniref:LOW QUALITY PROTEIN: pre-B-cell leukemia transcription factor-interacting protein 1-like n=1 Tax=Scyliorhinus torazame TaxID=75743 RepID=UPI003B5A66A0